MTYRHQILGVLAAAAAVLALPFLLRPAGERSDWQKGDPELAIISPHNEAIRQEFGRAFSDWHRAQYGRPVRVDWIALGGTTEISRFLEAEYTAAVRAWWKRQGGAWPPGAGEAMLERTFRADASDPVRRDALGALHRAFRETDDPEAFSCRIDLFFGGGAYDHAKAQGQGMTVAPWPPEPPPEGLFTDADGEELIPPEKSGEIWRRDTYFGCALSTFGICYNPDRLRDLGVSTPPARWEDLAEPVYFGHLGAADPTKSGSIAKAFEMIVHSQCREAVRRAGYTDSDLARFEAILGGSTPPPGGLPEGVPPAYQEAVEQGWLEGLRLVQRIGANARYFTESASKVPLDVASGQAAVGLAIDFYARYQAECSRAPDGTERMRYLTPVGGSSVSADPISLLRGAPHRELAIRFMQFALGEDGQKLWNYRPGTPGGPRRFALRRLPIRRDFYPSPGNPRRQAVYERHAAFTSDPLGDPSVDPYVLAEAFPYQARWTGAHFGVQRDLIKAMCLDSGEELHAAWKAILDHGGPAAQPAAMALLGRLPDRPEPVTWRSAPDLMTRHRRLDLLREWTIFFRASYREARAAVKE